MKNAILLVFALLVVLLAGCPIKGQKPDGHNTGAADVQMLFEADGVKVYRFQDLGNYHWYAVDREGRVAHIK